MASSTPITQNILGTYAHPSGVDIPIYDFAAASWIENVRQSCVHAGLDDWDITAHEATLQAADAATAKSVAVDAVVKTAETVAGVPSLAAQALGDTVGGAVSSFLKNKTALITVSVIGVVGLIYFLR